MACLSLALLCPATLRAGEPKGVNWPSFRGRRAKGIAEGYPLPTKWNAETAENVKWKAPIDGLGHSSPVIWRDRIFVTTAISGKADPQLKVGLYGDVASVDDDTQHRWLVYCLDKQSGKILWKKTAHKGVPKIKRHPKATHANSTPATDGRHLVVFFGSEGLYCYDLGGKRKWKKDLGTLDAAFFAMPEAQWEFGSSPVIHKDKVFVQCDVLKGSFVAALDIDDGREIWRTPRDDVPTWGTPTIYKKGDKTLVIVNGYKHIGAYDAATGKEVWRLEGGGDIPVPTPVVAHGLVFIASAHGAIAPLYAIRPLAEGDISLAAGATSNEHIAWSTLKNGAYMQTPLVYGDYVYSGTGYGVVNCYEAKTGKLVKRQRLGRGQGGFTASPVAGDGKLYFTGEDGDIYVIAAGPDCKLLATNPMAEVCMATPAISEGTLFFRTKSHLVAIAGPAKGESVGRRTGD